jgi:hypothetical protein
VRLYLPILVIIPSLSVWWTLVFPSLVAVINVLCCTTISWDENHLGRNALLLWFTRCSLIERGILNYIKGMHLNLWSETILSISPLILICNTNQILILTEFLCKFSSVITCHCIILLLSDLNDIKNFITVTIPVTATLSNLQSQGKKSEILSLLIKISLTQIIIL